MGQVEIISPFTFILLDDDFNELSTFLILKLNSSPKNLVPPFWEQTDIDDKIKKRFRKILKFILNILMY
tara:strand:+ start:2760 stop:2966 length:207 start_codon:yes stop_codon:yes gene_type:complete